MHSLLLLGVSNWLIHHREAISSKKRPILSLAALMRRPMLPYRPKRSHFL
jgi:hypothetical protein